MGKMRKVGLKSGFRKWRLFRKETLALFFILGDSECPLRAKFVTLASLAYLLIPLDSVPDFIPVFGLLDDLILVPLGFALAARLTPPAILNQASLRAEAWWRRFRYKFFFVLAGILILFTLVTYFIWIALQSPPLQTH